jgi:negative regulator of flagellin synthesis FlgM
MTNISDVMNSFSKAAMGQKVDKPLKQDTQAQGTMSDAPQQAVVKHDQVDFSPQVSNILENASFDRAKVEAIKEAIQNGNYPLDARKIAESMAGLEKLIGG